MTDESSAFKSLSNLAIFRPWQLSGIANEDKNVEKSYQQPTHSGVGSKQNLESQPSTSSAFKSNEPGTSFKEDVAQCTSIDRCATFAKLQMETMKRDRLEAISDSLVSSSSEKNHKERNVSSEKLHRKGQKRKHDEDFNSSSSKQAKTDVLLSPVPFPIHETPSFLGTPSLTGTSSSRIIQDTPTPTGFPFLPAGSTFLPPSSHFGPLVPLLEPPIFVPAAEVERVCVRRPRPKRFSCAECGAAFSNRGQLSGHCRIHTGERPFRCGQPGCGKRFTRNEELTRHRRIHSGLRPFACGICPKRFGRKDHLKKHLRTHTRHVMPPFPPLPHFDHLQHLQHVHHLQQLHHLQQIQRLQMHLPLVPVHHEAKKL